MRHNAITSNKYSIHRQNQSYLMQTQIIKLDRKYRQQNTIFCRQLGKKISIGGLFRLIIRRRVFLETFRTKCSSSLEESPDEMSPAENSSTLLTCSATQFVKLSATDGTGYRYDSYLHEFILAFRTRLKTYLHTLFQRYTTLQTFLAICSC